jgi:predicted nuclease of restriction endonuclease-like (RecB) superfamily
MGGLDIAPVGYMEWLADLKTRIRAAQMRATLSANREMVLMYWRLGRDILERQARDGWGSKVVDRLARDLRVEFPAMRGFSPRNLKYMRAFAEAWPDAGFVQQVAAQLPWFHLCTVLDKLDDRAAREWYLAKAIEHGWSRNVLVMQIETEAHARGGRATTNFDARLPSPQSDLARETLKDPYRLDFIGLGPEARERDLEGALVSHISRFLLELGAGFAFVGRQVHLEVGGEDFYLDLLFYHLRLRCYVVVELKAGEFKPEHAGKLNFYLSAVDVQVRGEHDGPTIGLILCKTKNRVVAEYALRDTSKPMGIAEYQLVHALPAQLETSLPSIEQLEAELKRPNDQKRT